MGFHEFYATCETPTNSSLFNADEGKKCQLEESRVRLATTAARMGSFYLNCPFFYVIFLFLIIFFLRFVVATNLENRHAYLYK